MRNFVVKNDFNRASAHKSLKDYTRASKQDLMDMAQNELDDMQWEEECEWMAYDEQWESSNATNHC